jgi:membrane protein YqaA with SNARE-associated domain
MLAQQYAFRHVSSKPMSVYLHYPIPVCQLVDQTPVIESEMEGSLLLTILREKRIEIKYTIITLVLAGGLFLLRSSSVFDGLEHQVNTMMDTLVQYGALGTFLIALLSNWTLVIQMPYNLPMFTVLLYADRVWEVVFIGAATGLGGAIGEVLSYGLARAITARVSNVEDSALFRWTRRHIERRPGLIPYLVCFASGVPVPDAVMIVPVAMVRYPWRKVIVPMLIGKLFQNIVVAFLFRYAAESASSLVSTDINIDLAAFLVVLFVVIVAYQIEKSRLAKRESTVGAAKAAAARSWDNRCLHGRGGGKSRLPYLVGHRRRGRQNCIF